MNEPVSVTKSAHRAHRRFGVGGFCDVALQLRTGRINLPVRDLGAGGFGALRPDDFVGDKAIERGLGIEIPCELRLLDKLIVGRSRPIYRVATHAGFRFEGLSMSAAIALTQATRLLSIGAGVVPVLRPVSFAPSEWLAYHGNGPCDLWVAQDCLGQVRMRLSFLDGRYGSFGCRYEDGRFQLQVCGRSMEGRADPLSLRQILLVLAGAQQHAPLLRGVIERGLAVIASASRLDL